jgi:hypothetical protein
MGKKDDGDDYSARKRTLDFQNDDRKPSPIPLENCPWCGTKLKPSSFQLLPNTDQPRDLHIYCSNRHCDFSGSKRKNLPIVTVDEAIYRRLPCFMIATVDKFASLPWVGETGALFGLDFVVDAIAKRAKMHDKELTVREAEALRQKVENTVQDLLDLWERIANDKVAISTGSWGSTPINI